MQEFIDFLKKIEESSFEINTTVAGNAIISQSQRNELRKEGQQKMMEGIKI